MIKHSILATLLLVLVPLNVAAQPAEQAAPAAESSVETVFDTSYRPSPSVSARLQREFLDGVRWSAGVEARDSLTEAFAERSPTEIWQELVASDGLTTNNVTDALTSYWVLNWVAANGAYAVKVDSAPVQRQLQIAFANDPNFHKMGDQQRQELAEGYILNFLVEHAALNTAVEKRDVETLNRLAAAAVARFRRDMKVNLLALVPGPDGFAARPVVAE
ncbi:DUF6683 family protein [Devosia sp. CAU 1758]